MTNPTAYALSQVEWGYFGTLTYKTVVPAYVRHSMAMAFFYEMARKWEVRPRELVWVLREEAGEIGGRMHHHFLIQQANRKAAIFMCFVMKHTWEVKLGGGMSRIRVYSRQLAGADYVTKSVGGANAYELGKFNENASRLTYSHRLVSILKRSRQDARVMQGDNFLRCKTVG